MCALLPETPSFTKRIDKRAYSEGSRKEGRNLKKPLTAEEINWATLFVLLLSLVLLVPWLMMAPLAAMAFDPGPSPGAYVFVWSAWTYPICVVLVAVFRRKAPLIVLLPCLNVVGFFLGGR